MPPLPVVPGGTVTGTLTSAPLLVMVTVPPDSVAVTLPLASAAAQAPWSESTRASLTSVI